jgi:hypothetical protein
MNQVRVINMGRLGIHSRGFFLASIILILATQACVEAELSTQLDETPIRNDSERPPDPSTDPNAPLPDQGTPDMDDAPEDMAPDAPIDLDMPPVVDMPDMTPSPDMPVACAMPAPCQFGAQECVGSQIRTCTRDANMCSVWEAPRACSAGFTCLNSSCQPEPPTCVDNDGDQRGAGCAAGPDCDDNDRTRYPGAPELCDGRDNDCNNLIDDGIPGVGMSCSVGMGACLSTGSQICDSQGNIACDATPRAGSPEVCDGIDNDCNGQIDDGITCNVAGVCPNDTYQEPNDTNAAAWGIPINTPVYGLTCTGDKDFYKLNGLTPGQSTRVNLAFPDSLADLELYLYKDGVQTSSSTSSTDNESLTFTPAAGSTYTLEVRPYSGGMTNLYRLEFMPASARSCSSEDVMENNDTSARAAVLIRGWEVRLYSCANNDDWFELGTINAGETVSVETTGAFFSEDLDLELYWRDASGQFILKDLSDSSGGDEYVSHRVTAADAGRYYAKVFNFGYGDRYDIVWSKN